MPQITPNLVVSWDGVSWTDETAYLVSANGSFSFTRPADFLAAGGGAVDQATITLANAAGRYLTRLNAKTFFQRHVRLSVDVGAGVQRIFSGAIDSMAIAAPNATTAGQVTLNCVTQEGPYLQKKFDLTFGDFRALSDSPITESDWFNLILDRISSPLTRDFDPGMVVIPWLWTDDESILEEFWQAAAAAGGVFFTNILGHVVYRNASTFAKSISNPVETLSRAANSYAAITLQLDQDNLYSDVTVEVSTRSIGDLELLWSPEDYENLVVPPAGTLKVTATYDDPVYQFQTFEWDVAGAGGASFAAFVGMSRVDYAQKSVLTFTNSHPTEAAYIKYFRITGNPVVGGPTFERVANSTSTFWTTRDRRNRSIRENVYVQTPVQAQFVADLVLDESQAPRSLVRLSGVPGKPSRFVGDVVKVQDSTVSGSDIIGQIESLSWQLGVNYTHDLTIHDFGSIYQYAPYFILNTDTVGGARKMFY